MKKLLIRTFLLFLPFLFFPIVAHGQDLLGGTGNVGVTTDANAICGVGEQDLSKFVSSFFQCGLGLIGGVALLFIIYGGFLLVMSSGNPQRIQEGREYITYAIIGLVLAIFALVIMEVVGVNILKIPGFSS